MEMCISTVTDDRVGLVVTSVLTSADVSLTSGNRSPDETDGAAGSVTHSIFDVNLENTDGKGNAT